MVISPNGVAPTRIVGVSASDCYPPIAPQSPEEAFFWHRLTRVVPEKVRKTVVVVVQRTI